MRNASEIYTLNSEDAAALCRELLTSDTPPPSGGSLYLREKRPPSIVIERKTIPFKRRMWSPVEVRQWCAERQPPRIRKALVCLARLEIEASAAAIHLVGDERSTCDVLAEILAAGDEP